MKGVSSNATGAATDVRRSSPTVVSKSRRHAAPDLHLSPYLKVRAIARSQHPAKALINDVARAAPRSIATPAPLSLLHVRGTMRAIYGKTLRRPLKISAAAGSRGRRTFRKNTAK